VFRGFLIFFYVNLMYFFSLPNDKNGFEFYFLSMALSHFLEEEDEVAGNLLCQ
jgi:hypothetical protein